MTAVRLRSEELTQSRDAVFRSRTAIVQQLLTVAIVNFVVWGIGTAAAPEPWNAFLFFTGLISTALSLWRAFRISVVLEAEGVIIKNYWRTYRLAWRDITWLQETWTWMGATPVRVLALASDRRRLFARILATAGGRRARLEFLKSFQSRREATHVTIHA